MQKVGDGAYELLLPKHMQINPVINVSLLTKSALAPFSEEYSWNQLLLLWMVMRNTYCMLSQSSWT